MEWISSWQGHKMMTVSNLIFTAAGSGSKYGGKIITYSIGSGGSASGNNASGNNGGNTSATFEGTTITGNGGNGAVSIAVSGNWNVPSGGGFSGGDGGSNGGNGGGPASGTGAGSGSGGAIGAANGFANRNGQPGAQSNNTNLSDLQTAIESAGYSWTYPGSIGSSLNSNTNATGFGCGGGSVARFIDYVNGGNGLYGGGSGSFSYGSASSISGAGGNGAVVCQFVGATTTYVVLTSGTSYTVPSGTDSVKIWVVGAGGSGSNSSQYNVGKGGAAGGVAWKTWS